MQAVDTNVLVRIFIDDPSNLGQVENARSFARNAKSLFISQVVQIESYWILDSCYKLNQSEIFKILSHLNHNQVFMLENKDVFELALHIYHADHNDFTDCMLLAASRLVNCHLITFDKKLAKLKDVKLLV